MKYFTLNELIKSTTAKKYNISNTPDEQQKQNLILLVDNILDKLREAYGKPIIVDSGFRCKTLNAIVGGASNSQHTLGQAVDIRTVPDTPKENKKLWDLVIQLNLPFDQMINEFNYNWIHISYSSRNRRQKLISKKVKNKTVYEEIK